MPESIIDTELDEEVRKALILCFLCSKITIAPQSRVHPVSAVDLWCRYRSSIYLVNDPCKLTITGGVLPSVTYMQ